MLRFPAAVVEAFELPKDILVVTDAARRPVLRIGSCARTVRPILPKESAASLRSAMAERPQARTTNKLVCRERLSF